MSVGYYILPIVVLVAVVVFARFGQKKVLAQVQNMTPEQARQRINEYFADSFDLNPGEMLCATWIGEEFQGEQSTGRQVAGAALNSVSKAAIGVSTYVPQVRIGLTSTGRVLFSREYSDLGERGHFQQVAALPRGTRAVNAATAYPGREPKPPMQNPMGGGAAPTFIQFRAPSGEMYDVWVAPGQWVGADFPTAFHDLSATIPAQNVA